MQTSKSPTKPSSVPLTCRLSESGSTTLTSTSLPGTTMARSEFTTWWPRRRPSSSIETSRTRCRWPTSSGVRQQRRASLRTCWFLWTRMDLCSTGTRRAASYWIRSTTSSTSCSEPTTNLTAACSRPAAATLSSGSTTKRPGNWSPNSQAASRASQATRTESSASSSTEKTKTCCCRAAGTTRSRSGTCEKAPPSEASTAQSSAETRSTSRRASSSQARTDRRTSSRSGSATLASLWVQWIGTKPCRPKVHARCTRRSLERKLEISW